MVSALAGVTAAGHRFAQSLGFFDEGIWLTTAGWLRHGLLAIADGYTPYGPGVGAPGALATLLLGRREAQVVYATDAVVLAFAVLAAGWTTRRMAGWPLGLAVALLAALATVTRYAGAAALVVVGGCLLHVVVERNGGDLRRAVADDTRRLTLATVPLGLAAWYRPEWGIFVVPWVVVLLVLAGRSRRVLAPALVPLAVAALPVLVLVADGGVRHVWWWLDYALTDYSEQRATPTGPADALQAVTESYGSGPQRAGAELLVGYGAGVVLAMALLTRLLPARWRALGPDRAGVATMLAIAGILAAYAQSKRFFSGNAVAVAALTWTAIAVQPWRRRAVPAAFVVGALALTAPSVIDRLNAPSAVADARKTLDATRDREPVPGLNRTVMDRAAFDDLRAFRLVWRSEISGDRAFVANLRNQDAWGNSAIVYWLLDIRPAAWPVAYDPGLSDRDDVQEDAVRDLCASDAPIAMHTGTYERVPYPKRDDVPPLDIAMAYGWDDRGGTALHRVLVRNGRTPCDPHGGGVSDAALRERRDELLAADRVVAAGALAGELAERVARRGAARNDDDLALMVLGGYRPTAHVLGGRRVDPVLAAALGDRADEATRAAVVARARDRRESLVQRALALTAYRTRWFGAAPAAERDAVIAAAGELARRYPRAPLALQQVSDLGVASPQLADELRGRGAGGRRFLQYEFDAAVAAGARRRVVRVLRRLLPVTHHEPVLQGALLVRFADMAAAAGDFGCYEAMRDVANQIPGLDVLGGMPSPCADAEPLRSALEPAS